MIEIGVNKRAGNDANQPAEPAWKNTEIIQIKAISDLVYKYKPDEKENNGRGDEAQDEPSVFNIGFFWQENGIRCSVFGVCKWVGNCRDKAMPCLYEYFLLPISIISISALNSVPVALPATFPIPGVP